MILRYKKLSSVICHGSAPVLGRAKRGGKAYAFAKEAVSLYVRKICLRELRLS